MRPAPTKGTYNPIISFLNHDQRASSDFNENQPKEGRKILNFSTLLAGTKIMSK